MHVHSTCFKSVLSKGDFLKNFVSQVHITKKKYQNAMPERGSVVEETASVRHHAKTRVVAGDRVDQ